MMLKKVIVILLILMFAMQGVALAASGEVVLENTIYGGIIGGILGGAWYLLDDDEAGKKISTGVGLGIIAGFLLGMTDVSSIVEVENGEMHAGIPTIFVSQTPDLGTFYHASLLNVKFN
jgi:hypothetical protein